MTKEKEKPEFFVVDRGSHEIISLDEGACAFSLYARGRTLLPEDGRRYDVPGLRISLDKY